MLYETTCKASVSSTAIVIFQLLINGWLVGYLDAQPVSSTGKLYARAVGTGRTTGEIATLTLYNPTATAINTSVGACFIPSSNNYQGYVVLKTYSVNVLPLGTAKVMLEGYCTNVYRPAVPAGVPMTTVSEWVSWQDGWDFPVPAKPLAPGFMQVQTMPWADSSGITYPGTLTPFNFIIDANKFPKSTARLLLYAVGAAERAFDALESEQYWNVGQSIRIDVIQRRKEIVQQVFWAYTARLEGVTYGFSEFRTRTKAEMERALDQNQSTFPNTVNVEIEGVARDIWSDIELVGARAKLIPADPPPAAPIFQELPIGHPIMYDTFLTEKIARLHTTGYGGWDSLIPILLFLNQQAKTPALQKLYVNATALWDTLLLEQIHRISPADPAVLPQILELSGLLDAEYGRLGSADMVSYLRQLLIQKTNLLVLYEVSAFPKNNQAHIRTWRQLKSWEATHWYTLYCSEKHPLSKLPPQPQGNGISVAKDSIWVEVTWSDPQWKFVFTSESAVPDFRLRRWVWIPLAGVAAAGAVLYAVLSDKEEQPPIDTTCSFSPLFAVGNASCNQCNGSVSTTIMSPGLFHFQWSNGMTGAFVTDLCAGIASVTITDQTEKCSGTYSIQIEAVQTELMIQTTGIHPVSTPTASDGQVVVQLLTPGAVFPALIFVNGMVAGTTSAPLFTVDNLPVGLHEIRIVDHAGEGCTSNTIIAEILPPGLPPFPFEDMSLPEHRMDGIFGRYGIQGIGATMYKGAWLPFFLQKKLVRPVWWLFYEANPLENYDKALNDRAEMTSAQQQQVSSQHCLGTGSGIQIMLPDHVVWELGAHVNINVRSGKSGLQLRARLFFSY